MTHDHGTGMSRRGLMGRSAGAAALIAATCLPAACAPGEEPDGDRAKSPTPTPYDPNHLVGEIGDTGLGIITLGTGAGQTFNPGRAGMSTLLVVEGVPYLIDAGWGAARRIQQAAIDPLTIRAGFVSHMHADHIADLWNMFLGRLHSAAPERQIPVFGPAAAGFQSDPAQELPLIGEGRPGMRSTLEMMQRAFTADLNNAAGEFGNLSPVAESVVGRDMAMPVGDPDDTAPSMGPVTVHEDDLVRVTTVLVPHGPAFPAHAFRFETEHGTVTFSGDTARSDNVAALAAGSDLLVHEAIDIDYYAARGSGEEAIAHFEDTHTSPQDVGRLAAEAGVPAVLLSHLGPGSSEEVPDEAWADRVRENYDGEVVVGNDLVQRPVRAN